MLRKLPWLAPAGAIGLVAAEMEPPVPDLVWALPLSVSIVVCIVRFGSHSGHGDNRRK
jgi:hypothetical protein